MGQVGLALNNVHPEAITTKTRINLIEYFFKLKPPITK